MTYGVYWPIKKQHVPKTSAAKIRMLIWMHSKNMNNRTRDKRIRALSKVVPISDKLK